MFLNISNFIFCGLFFIIRTLVIQTMHYLFRPKSNLRKQIKTTLNDKEIKQSQYDREKVTWISILFSAIELYFLFAIGLIPAIGTIPWFTFKSIIYCLLSHLFLVEFIYYVVHVIMHYPSIYSRLHKHHHLSIIPTPKTSVSFLTVEHIFYDLLFAIPILVPVYFGQYSLFQILLYVPGMDLANTFGHTNVELLSLNWYNSLSGLFFYSTSFHHVHHKYFKYNYSLFVPMYDYIFGTYNIIVTEKEHTNAFYKQNKDKPKYAFMIHIIDLLSTAKTSLYSDDFTKTNDTSKLTLIEKIFLPFWIVFIFILKNTPLFIRPNFIWNILDSKTKHKKINGIIRPLLATTPDYLNKRDHTMNQLIQSCRQLKEQHPSINTIGLAALNKNKLFSDNGKDLIPFLNPMGIWIATGNTMTAAVVCQYIKREIPENSKIFINGSTSSIGYAVVCKAAKMGYNVTFHTKSKLRASALLNYLEKEEVSNVIWTDNVEDIANFDYVILGSSANVSKYTEKTKKILTFSIPSPVVNSKNKSIDAGEVTLPKEMISDNAMMCSKNTTHACHTGTWVHSVMKWKFNEVGKVDYNKLDEYWEIATNLGWQLTSNYKIKKSY